MRIEQHPNPTENPQTQNETYKIPKERLPEILQDEIDRIEKENIGENQKKSLKNFLYELAGDSNKYSTNQDRVQEVRTFLKRCFDKSVDIDNPSILELKEANRRLNEITIGVKDEDGDVKKSTRNDYLKSWRKYHNTMKGQWEVIQDPSLRKTIPRGNRHPELMKKLSTEDSYKIIERTEKFVELINSTENIRDALYISLLIELGARPCELHNISVEKIIRNGWDGESPSAIVKVPVKKVEKPPRRMLVTRSYNLLESWLKIRKRMPTTTDKLFVNLDSSGKGEKGTPTTENNLGKRVKKASKKMDMDISPYDLRHTSVQYWMGFSNMTEERLKEKYGWKTSEMIELYRNRTYDNLLKARKVIDGISVEREDHFAMWECSCGQKNCPTQEECHSCKKSRRLSGQM